MNNNLILCGFKGCGKTYFGSLLAQATASPFIDTDQCIEELYSKNISCREIYHFEGEERFRELEHLAIASLKGCEKSVIAIGGGTLVQEKNFTLLSELGKIIYLQADKEALRQRFSFSAYSFEELYAKRIPCYEHFETLSIIDKSDSQVIDALKELWHSGKQYIRESL